MASRAPREVDEHSVFLNVPFDAEYSPLFVALIAGLISLGRTPRCVLEIQESGQNRLTKIFDLISRCGASVHDLSRVTLSGDLHVPRFNMPFELGLAWALSQRQRHSLFLLEAKRFRLQASLSDLNGHDPHIHEGTQTGILRCVMDCFAKPAGAPPLSALERVTARLNAAVRTLQRRLRAPDPFQPHFVRLTIDTAAALARKEHLLA